MGRTKNYFSFALYSQQKLSGGIIQNFNILSAENTSEYIEIQIDTQNSKKIKKRVPAKMVRYNRYLFFCGQTIIFMNKDEFQVWYAGMKSICIDFYDDI